MLYPNSPDMGFGNNAGVEYALKNYGKTPAKYRENSHGIALSFRPPGPVYSVSEQIPSQHMIEPGATTDGQVCADIVPINSVADALPLVRGEAYLWFFGSVAYTDVFGQQRTDRFLFRYVQLRGKWRFQPYDYKHYNSSSVAHARD
ncbi:hypothetical protein XH99_19580 [Bradyrhizobium nanningense]|uniref:Uncharacterized protein n=1 Tax=Bradyrhizobium nanningense TaxID=1325118 RepID=A0A4Q0S417_9BRAD|nr:hypothetical protein XH84_36225 [Bradyrhizobium nanningense]RXH26565.1 hypothetical protein XH99_19580 [Bradyrhizobium nanningense]